MFYRLALTTLSGILVQRPEGLGAVMQRVPQLDRLMSVLPARVWEEN